jgi:SAM-dependent methyltransferase
VEFAKRGVYSVTASQLTRTEILSRMTAAEVEGLFDKDGDAVTVKSWVKEGISWGVGDVGEPETLAALGLQDMVVANNFLCHMDDSEAERCLRNIARSVRPNGYLIVLGIDLDVRTRVSRDLGWSPVQELLEEIHEGDEYMRGCWPCHYAGLEPFDKKRSDWGTRYAAAFQVLPAMRHSPAPHEKEPANA